MKQHEAVIIALENLGGIAALGDLNLETMKIKECEWKTKLHLPVSAGLCRQTRIFTK